MMPDVMGNAVKPFKELTAEDIKNMSGDEFSSMTIENLAAMSPQALAAISYGQLSKLRGMTLYDLHDTQHLSLLKTIVHGGNFAWPKASFDFYKALENHDEMLLVLDFLVKKNPELIEDIPPLDLVLHGDKLYSLTKFPNILAAIAANKNWAPLTDRGLTREEFKSLCKSLSPTLQPEKMMSRYKLTSDAKYILNILLRDNPALLKDQLEKLYLVVGNTIPFEIRINALRELPIRQEKYKSLLLDPYYGLGGTRIISSAFCCGELPRPLIEENLKLLEELLQNKPDLLGQVFHKNVEYLVQVLNEGRANTIAVLSEYLDPLIEFPGILYKMANYLEGFVPQEHLKFYTKSKLGQLLLGYFSEYNPELLKNINFDKGTFCDFFATPDGIGTLSTLACRTPHIFHNIEIDQNQLNMLLHEKSNQGLFFLDGLRRHGLYPFERGVHFCQEYNACLAKKDVPGMGPRVLYKWIHEKPESKSLPPHKNPTASSPPIRLYSPQKSIIRNCSSKLEHAI